MSDEIKRVVVAVVASKWAERRFGAQMPDARRSEPGLYDLDAASTSSKTSLQIRVVIASLMLATALVGLDNNIVNTALPRITSELHGLNHMSWIITSFMLGQCSVMPIYGKLSDTYGRKPLLIFALTLFLLGSGLCGFSSSLIQMACFRAVQGVGASGITILSSTIVADLVAPQQRGRVLGLFMGAFAAASLAGPLVGGAITSWVGWRWVFYINLPLGILVLGLLAFLSNNASRRLEKRVDYFGSILLIAAAACFILALSLLDSTSGKTSSIIWGLFGLFTMLTALLFIQEHRAPEPILAPKLFRQRQFLMCILTSVSVAFPFFGAIVFMPLYLQVVVGLSPLASGLALTPQIIGLVISSRTGGWLLSRNTGHTILIAFGVAGVATGLILLGLLIEFRQNLFCLEAALLVLGLGGGLVRPNLIIAAQTAVSKFETGAATAAILFVHTLSGTAGVACAQTVMNMRLRALLERQNPNMAMHNISIGGIDKLALMGQVQRTIVLNAYGSAIATIFLISGLIAGLGLCCACNLGKQFQKTDLIR